MKTYKNKQPGKLCWAAKRSCGPKVLIDYFEKGGGYDRRN